MTSAEEARQLYEVAVFLVWTYLDAVSEERVGWKTDEPDRSKWPAHVREWEDARRAVPEGDLLAAWGVPEAVRTEITNWAGPGPAKPAPNDLAQLLHVLKGQVWDAIGEEIRRVEDSNNQR